MLSFVLATTAAAAAILLTLCMTLANGDRPETNRIEAMEGMTKQQILEEIDELNRTEAAKGESAKTESSGQGK